MPSTPAVATAPVAMVTAMRSRYDRRRRRLKKIIAMSGPRAAL
ncbi:hypothetical protein [Corynebacterium pacaense]|nr:hypothetical protein [Corynebacterium pacaense]